MNPVPATPSFSFSGDDEAAAVELRRRLEQRLREQFQLDDLPSGAVRRAMQDAMLGRGKRLRPMLMLLTARAFGIDPEGVMDAACAVEMVHTASLLLDDLPCMDDAAERRGQPAVHVRFGEDVAVLASVALLSQAFGAVAGSVALTPLHRAQACVVLSEAIGAAGLVQGQYHDLRDRAQQDPERLERTNDLKTGSLFKAALVIPALVAGAEPARVARLSRCAMRIGQAFQLKDDLDDTRPAIGAMKMDAGGAEGACNLVDLLGREEAAARLQQHVERAMACLDEALPDAHALRSIIRSMAPVAERV